MRVFIAFCMLALTAVSAGFTAAQTPEERDRPHPDHRDGIREALDANGDHKLDADEIKNATTSLAKADANGDGTIDHEEFRPPLPPRPPMPRGEGGFRGPPRDGSSEQRPPREGEFEGRPRRVEGQEGPPPRGGRPPRDGSLRGADGPRPEGGGPTPERFVERAMSFDADGDGKLDRAEVEKFAGEAMQRLRAGMMAARGMDAERGRGFREGEGPRRRPEGDEGGERPERPRRPE